MSCIISFLYIKPQHIPLTSLVINHLILLLGNMKLLDEAYHDTKLLKKLQLNGLWLLFCRNFAPHINNIGVLFIGYSEDANHALVGGKRFDSLDVYIHALVRATIAYIYAKLVHRETVAFKVFPKTCGFFALQFSIRRKVEH